MKRVFIGLLLSLCAAAAVAAQPGTISGKLTYPGEWIPADLAVCVVRTGTRTGNPYCSSDTRARLDVNNITFRVDRRRARYEIVLPAGVYHVYATFPRGKAPTPGMEGMRAYYNDFVRCGMMAQCTSKRIVPVTVRPGRQVKNITVGDWYD
jgi:hypothetical protein